MLRTTLLVAMTLLIGGGQVALAEILKENVTLDKSTNQAKLKGVIKGDTTRDYLIEAKKGQTLKVDLSTSNRSSYFNVMKANADEAIFTGSTSGDNAKIAVPDDGVYAVRVYLMRNAARRKETAKYSLTLALQGAESSPQAKKSSSGNFSKELKLQGISFNVVGTSTAAGTEVSITPKGLKGDNKTVKQSTGGVIVGAEVADLNVDGSPEIYVYTRSDDGKNKGGLVAYSANKLKSLSAIHMPSLTDKESQGYKGSDEFAVVENVLVRRFPIAAPAEKSSTAKTKLRQFQYKLSAGEAGWVLKLDKVLEY